MSERNDLTPSPGTSEPPPAPSAAESLAKNAQALPPADAHEDGARTRIASLEREAKALGADPASALIFHEIGLLWEDPLKNPRNAAVAYQNAYRIAPRFVANLRSARRLFTDVGNWQMALQLLDAELAGIDDARTRAGLLYEKAVMLEERLGRSEDATACFAQALALDCRDLTLLVQLEGVFSARGDFESLVRVYRQLADALEEAPLKAHYLTQCAQVLENRLQKPQEAAEAYRAAFALERKDALRISAIKRLAERGNDPEELLSALLAEAELLGAHAGPTSLEIAKIYERLGRREDALSALLAARRANPTDLLVLSALASSYEAEDRHEDLADVLMTWLGCINDEAELVAINLRLGELYEERLKRPDDAIARYRAILARIPGHAQALASLGKLYFKKQDWAELIATFEAEAAAGEERPAGGDLPAAGRSRPRHGAGPRGVDPRAEDAHRLQGDDALQPRARTALDGPVGGAARDEARRERPRALLHRRADPPQGEGARQGALAVPQGGGGGPQLHARARGAGEAGDGERGLRRRGGAHPPHPPGGLEERRRARGARRRLQGHGRLRQGAAGVRGRREARSGAGRHLPQQGRDHRPPQGRSGQGPGALQEVRRTLR